MTTDNYQFYINKITTLEQQVARLVNQSSYGELKYGQSTATVTPSYLSASPSLDYTVSSNATLSDVTGFSVALEAASKYAFLGSIIYISGATPDAKYSIVSTGSTIFWSSTFADTAGPVTTSLFYSASPVVSISGLAVDFVATFMGNVSTTSADTLRIQWAQSTSNASNTTMRATSNIVLWKI